MRWRLLIGRFENLIYRNKMWLRKWQPHFILHLQEFIYVRIPELLKNPNSMKTLMEFSDIYNKGKK